LGSYDGYNSCDLYLEFTDCTGPFTIDNLGFCYYPLEDDGVTSKMQTLADCHSTTMQGVHAVMGWAMPSYASDYRFDEFFQKWIVPDGQTGEAMSTVLAYLSLGTEVRASASMSDQVRTRAVAVPYGPSGDKYHYLYETWDEASSTADAPTGKCMIAWAIPYFDNGGYPLRESD
jgi:hypothetical protein